MATQHYCRLGRWYDNVSDPVTRQLPSFIAIDEPHCRVHEAGEQALVALAAGDMRAAQRSVAELRQHSDRVLCCLDELARDFPSTIAKQSTAAEAAIAA